MAFELLGLDHVVLRVANMDRALAFYCGVLGCREERRVDAIGLVQLRAGRSLIDLIDAAAAPPPADAHQRDLDHFCLRIEPFDETALRAHLAAHGVDAGETVSRYGAEGQGPSVYLHDPDGNMVELKGPPAAQA